MKNNTVDHNYFLDIVFGMKNTIDLDDYTNKSELLTAYKTFFMEHVHEIREKTVFSETLYQKVNCQENFFMITMEEPLEWMLIGMRLGLAFVNSDNDLDYILNGCTWNKGIYYNIQKLCAQKTLIVNSLIKICEDPFNRLSKEKISK